MSLRNLYTVLILFACTVSTLFAQDYIVDKQSFSVVDGLLHREVNSIFQDSRNFIWVATKQGLNRFDGTNFDSYTPESHGFLHRNFMQIAEDDKGFLWLIPWKPFSNFDIWNPLTGEHTTFQDKFGDDARFSKLRFETNILTGENGTIYLGCENPGGLFRYHSARGPSFDQFADVNQLTLLAMGKEGQVWCHDEQNRVLELDNQGRRLHVYEHETKVRFWSRDSRRKVPFVYGTERIGNQEQGQVDNYIINEAGERIRLENHEADLAYLATAHTSIGSDLLWTDDQLYSLSGIPEVAVSNAAASVLGITKRCYLLDVHNNLWIGGNFGLHLVNIRKNRFDNYLSQSEDLQDGNHVPCRGIHVQDSILYLMHEFLGLTIINPKKGIISYLQPRRGEHDYRAITQLKDGRLICTSGNSIDVFDGDQLQSTHRINHSPWSMMEVNPGIVYTGTERGIQIFDVARNSVEPYDLYQEFDELGEATIYYFYPEDNGDFWICSNRGLYKGNLSAGIQARYWQDGEDEFNLPANTFYHLNKDRDGLMWLATDGQGLIRWDPVDDNYLRYTKNLGLSNDVVYAVYEDNQNHLWLSSDFGLMRLDKLTGQVKSFLEKDGITHNEFNRISHFKDSDGRIYFGGLNGVTSLDPRDFHVQVDVPAPPLVILSYQQFDGATNQLEDRTNTLDSTAVIKLKPADRYFQLEFALLSYIGAKQNRYAYRIEGIHQEWQYQSENTLRFGRLPYGEYVLQIRAQDASGKWSANELNIPIHATSPFYLKTWFLIIMGLVLASIGPLYLRWRTYNLTKIQVRLENEVDEKTKTIRQQSEELRHLDTLKSRFFTNVSHELRTPLSLMLGPIGTALKSGQLDKKNQAMLALSQQNGKKLLELVNEILDLSKLDAKKLELKASRQALMPLMRRLLAQFESHALEKQVELTFTYLADPNLEISLDAPKFEIVVNNLLSNALKFTDHGGKVSVTVKDTDQMIKLYVEDSGVGIHPDDLPNIFDRFYQSKLPDAPTQGGTGIGLALCWEYARLFGGQILVESEYKKGSRFLIEFPKVEVISSSLNDESLEAEPDASEAGALSEEAMVPLSEALAKILIVEDNYDLRQYMKIILGDKFQVLSAEHGKEALDILGSCNGQNATEAPVDLIISDIMMPVMDGFQLLEALKSDDRYCLLPVIMVTAVANARHKLKALRIGVDDYVIKPFEEDELLARVTTLIKNYRERVKLTSAKSSEQNMTSERQVDKPLFAVEDLTWLEDLEEIVLSSIDHYSLSADFIADKLAISRRQFFRRVKELTGKTPNAYINEVRFRQARELLEDRRYKTVKEVSHAVGMRDPLYFSKQFRLRFGKLPSVYLS